MSEIKHIEDVFEKFHNLVTSHQLLLSNQDLTATYSLYECCVDPNKALTINQANYLLKILSRYQNAAADLDLDYSKELSDPTWQKKFRVIDLTKRVFVEVDKDKKTWICLKFPFSLKDTFEKEIRNARSTHDNNRWDHERKIRMVDAHRHNVMQINEFVSHHNFDIDDTFLSLVSHVEEVWQQQDNIFPRAEIRDDRVCLINATADAIMFFDAHKNLDLEHDLLLAKSMNFIVRLDRKPETMIELICAEKTNQFWIKENLRFFELYKKMQGHACIVLDRNTKNVIDWLKNFVSDAETAGVKNDIKICFRDSSEAGSELNLWIKEQGLGGKVDEGRIYVFMQKPPKWLFRDRIDVKLIGTNCYVPPLSDNVTASWIFHHPCLCYLGDVKPTEIRDHKIVNV